MAWVLVVCCWLIQGLAARHSMDADGVSYQNIADAALSGDWRSFLNGYWSPGFPFLLTLWRGVFHPTPYGVPMNARFLQIAGLVLAIFAFEYFLKVFLQFRGEVMQVEGECSTLSDRSIRILGYATFLWITVFLVPASLNQPDIWLFALYLLASSFCIAIFGGAKGGWMEFGSLGFTLGLAYLVKAVMFPLSFAFFLGLLCYRKIRSRLSYLVFGVVVFLAVCLPFVIALSKEKGRLTYGDAGAVNFRQMTNGKVIELAEVKNSDGSAVFPAAPHMQDFSASSGTPYPPWTDPSVTAKDTPYSFSIARLQNRIHIVLRFYFDLFATEMAGLLCGLLILILSARKRSFLIASFGFIGLWFPAACGLALYALVRAEGRFLAGFIVAIFVSILGALQFEDKKTVRALELGVVSAVSLLLASQTVFHVGHHGLAGAHDRYPDWQVVQALNGNGVRAGDRVSYLGDGLSDHVWAYLAHVTIAAEIPSNDMSTFWAAGDSQRQYVAAWLRTKGIKAVISRDVPPPAYSTGWTKVGDTSYAIWRLTK